METSHMLFWLALVVIVGHVMTKQYGRKRTRQSGVLLGVIAFVVSWWNGSYADPNAPDASVWLACGMLGVAVTAISWIVLTLLQLVLSGPLELLGSTFGFLRPRLKTAVETTRDKHSQKALDKARERIAQLESNPDKLPDNTDELTIHVVTWCQQREAILRGDGEQYRHQLDRIDATYSRKLVDILERQETHFRGKNTNE